MDLDKERFHFFYSDSIILDDPIGDKAVNRFKKFIHINSIA